MLPPLPALGSLTSPLLVAAALEDKLSALTVEQREVLEKDLAKKERKDQAKAEREEAKLAVRYSP